MKTDNFDSTWTGDDLVEKNGRRRERLKNSEHRQHGRSHLSSAQGEENKGRGENEKRPAQGGIIDMGTSPDDSPERREQRHETGCHMESKPTG